MSNRFALIGPGRVGSAIARALFEKDYQPVAVVGRNLQSTREACAFIGCNTNLTSTDPSAAGDADLILLAVPDDCIAAVAFELQHRLLPLQDTVLIHFSGVHPAALMRHSGGQASLFSLHPLLPFADRQQALERLSLAPYIGEGDASARPMAEALCAALGGQLEYIPTLKKPLYHAAACLASNYFVTLTAAATTLLQQCGIEHQRGEKLLLPLLQATLDNVATCGTRQGLTGPIVRGDIGSISTHLQALRQHQPDLLELYCQLGHRTALLAQDSGRLKEDTAQAITRLLNVDSVRNKDE